MAWIAIVPPSLRHPRERYQVRYQDGPHQRSSGIYPTLRRAEAERGTIERNGRDPLPVPTEPDPAKAQTLLGEYVATKWWPPWKDQHPSSGYGTRKKVEKRILPPFGNIPLAELDPSTIGTWKAAMAAERLTPRTVNTYLSLLRTILNAAVDDDYLARSPLLGRSGAGRTAATRNQPVSRREVWLVREQLDRLAEAIDPRYRALILVAALTGMRWASWSPCAGPTPASTNLWTTVRGPGGCGRPGDQGPPTDRPQAGEGSQD